MERRLENALSSRCDLKTDRHRRNRAAAARAAQVPAVAATRGVAHVIAGVACCRRRVRFVV